MKKLIIMMMLAVTMVGCVGSSNNESLQSDDRVWELSLGESFPNTVNMLNSKHLKVEMDGDSLIGTSDVVEFLDVDWDATMGYFSDDKLKVILFGRSSITTGIEPLSKGRISILVQTLDEKYGEHTMNRKSYASEKTVRYKWLSQPINVELIDKFDGAIVSLSFHKAEDYDVLKRVYPEVDY